MQSHPHRSPLSTYCGPWKITMQKQDGKTKNSQNWFVFKPEYIRGVCVCVYLCTCACVCNCVRVCSCCVPERECNRTVKTSKSQDCAHKAAVCTSLTSWAARAREQCVHSGRLEGDGMRPMWPAARGIRARETCCLSLWTFLAPSLSPPLSVPLTPSLPLLDALSPRLCLPDYTLNEDVYWVMFWWAFDTNCASPWGAKQMTSIHATVSMGDDTIKKQMTDL